MSYFGNNFTWFIGVVEDRNDPMEMGRVRVRCYSIHSADKNAIPTDSLPWAQVMMPVTSASVAGIGDSPTGIAQGSTVVGFFTDGASMQQPFVMGTFHGEIPGEVDQTKGFNDPMGVNPVRVAGPGTRENDVPFNAQKINVEETDNHLDRLNTRVESVDTASPPKVTSVAPDKDSSYYEAVKWDQPYPYGGSLPDYPYNKVKETERGHIFEVNDTPNNESLLQYHTAGTYEEIIADGTRTVRVVGDNFEVIFEDNNMIVKGDMNMTIRKDMRLKVEGNYHLEVDGNYTEDIAGDKQIKIGNSLNMEIDQDYSANIAEDYATRIGNDETRDVVRRRDTTVGATNTLYIDSDYFLYTDNRTNIYSKNMFTNFTESEYKVTAKEDIKIDTPANMITEVDTNVTTTIGGNETQTVTGTKDETVTGVATLAFNGNGSEVTAKNGGGTGITLTSHTHTDPAHALHGTETSTPNN